MRFSRPPARQRDHNGVNTMVSKSLATAHLSALPRSSSQWRAGPRRLREDTLKIAVGQRGNWDTSVAEIGQRAGIFKKHGLDARDPLHAGRRRDAAGGDLGQRRHRRRARHHGRAGGVFQGRAGARHRRARPPARRSLLVRAGEFADQVAEGHRRQDDRLFDQRLVDQRHRHGLRRSNTASRRSRPRPAARRRR